MTVYADVFRYRELFSSLFRRDLRAKYQGSAARARSGRCCTRSCSWRVYLLVFSLLWRSPRSGATTTGSSSSARCRPGCSSRPPLQGSTSEPDREREPDPQGAFPAAARSALDRGDEPRELRGDARRRDRPEPRVTLPEARSTVWLAIPLGALFACIVAGVALALASLERALPRRRAPRSPRCSCPGSS